MQYNNIKGTLCLMLLATASVWSISEHKGVSFTAEYLGEKTTEALNQGKSPVSIESGLDFSLINAPSIPDFSIKPQMHSLNGAKIPRLNQLIGHNFTAATVSNAPQTNVIPPNPTGWVGEKQFVLMTYQCIRSFDKCTGEPDGVLDTDAASFFDFGANDVRIEYDRFAKRWYVTAEFTTLNNTVPDLYLAVSSDSIITETTNWFFYRFPNALIIPQITPLGSGSLDYNQLAVDRNAVYISMDTFDNAGDFVGTSLIVIEKKSLLKQHPLVTVFPGILPGVNPTIFGSIVPPADNFDKDAEFGYLVHAPHFAYPSGITYDWIYFYRVVNPCSDQPILVGPISVHVPHYSEPANAPHLGNLYGPAGFLQTGLFGGLEAPHVRDHQLYACHSIQVNSNGVGTPDGDRVGVRWYQFDMTGDPSGHGNAFETALTVPKLVQYGTLFDTDEIDESPRFYYTPSIMTNKRNDLIIEATASGEDDFTNVVYASRCMKDPKGFLSSAILITKNNSNTYNYGPLADPTNGNIGQRWGDESSLVPDPENDLDIWSTGEWAAVPNGWGIQVTQLKPND